jgi:outer membrane protein TolC
METHPLIRATEADYEAAERQLRLEVRRQYPDLDIGPSYSLEEGFPRLGFGFGLSLPLWNRNRQAIAQANAARDAAKMQAELTVELVLSELAQAEARLDFAGKRREVLSREVIPLVDKQLSESRALLELGEIDVLLLREALTGSLETKLDLLDATLAEATAANELSQMIRPRWCSSSKSKEEK